MIDLSSFFPIHSILSIFFCCCPSAPPQKTRKPLVEMEDEERERKKRWLSSKKCSTRHISLAPLRFRNASFPFASMALASAPPYFHSDGDSSALTPRTDILSPFVIPLPLSTTNTNIHAQRKKNFLTKKNTVSAGAIKIDIFDSDCCWRSRRGEGEQEEMEA